MKYAIFTIAIVITLIFGCQPKQSENYGSDLSDDPKLLAQGEELFTHKCSSCHNFIQDAIGPNLSGVTLAVESDWIRRFIKNPAGMMDSQDKRSLELFDRYKIPMPGFSDLTDPQLDAILSFLHTHKKKPIKNTGSESDIKNPLLDTIQSSGIVAELEFITQVPASQDKPPLARINKLDFEKQSGRLFVSDLRGIMYELKSDKVHPYLSLKETKKEFVDSPGLGTGFGSFAFHPDFSQNGLFYTSHTERYGNVAADFSFDDSIKVILQWVVTEWKCDDPNSVTFKGSNRELMRIDFITGIHGMQEISFNPTAKEGEEDYGKLYICLGDGGSVSKGFVNMVDHHGTEILSSILRIDPKGSNSENGKYGIPKDNPFVDLPNNQKEVWAYGFRNPNKLTWDDNGRLLATDIGQAHIEEINVIEPGKFYGWPIREGTFKLNPNSDINLVYPLPEDDANYVATYPFLQYDHDEGKAISGGFVGREGMLDGKYIFGDILTGRTFVSDLKSSKNPSIQSLDMFFNDEKTSLKSLIGKGRIDLRFGHNRQGQIFVMTKADGKIYKIKKAFEPL